MTRTECDEKGRDEDGAWLSWGVTRRGITRTEYDEDGV